MTDDPRVEAVARELAPGLNWKNGFDGHLKREARQKARAVLIAADRAAWRPIEEAPKDGRGILGFVQPEWIEGFFWNGEEWSFLSDGDAPTKNEHQPTHFMPLPAPPEDI